MLALTHEGSTLLGLTLLSAVSKAGFEHADHWVTPALEAALSHWLLAGPDEEKVGVPEPWLAARATTHHRVRGEVVIIV